MAEGSKTDLQRRLLATFEEEAQERLQAVTDHVLVLEKGADAAQTERRVKEIFREAHTLKGAARGLGLTGVERIAHRLESVFGLVQRGQASVGPELYDLVYRCLDAMATLVRTAVTGQGPAVDVDDLCGRLESLASGGRVAEKTAEIQPPAGPASVPADRHDVPGEAAGATAAPVPVVTGQHGGAVGDGPAAAARAPDETVRVAVAKLDALMAQVGELQVARSAAELRLGELRDLAATVETWEAQWRQVRGTVRQVVGGSATGPLPDFLDTNEGHLKALQSRLAELRRQSEGDNRRTGQVLIDLQDEVRRVRMLPIATVFEPLPRLVRDLGRELGKDVALTIQGAENELDRAVLERVRAPLIHLLRNSVDHGLEKPEVRQRAGKPAQGTIAISASQRGGSLLVEVVDDGGGIDVERVRAAAVAKGLLTAEAAAGLSEREALWLIFRSGLSTRRDVSDISGRGVGLDVVLDTVERLGGLLDLDTKLGSGTRFSIQLPLSVATTLCLLVRSGSASFALPVTNVLRIVRAQAQEIGRSGGREALSIDGVPLALQRLSAVLGLPSTRPAAGAPIVAVIVGSAEKRVAFVVDDVLGAQEVVVKPLPAPLGRVRRVAGAAILGTGEVVTVLNAADLLRPTAGPLAATIEAPSEPTEPARSAVILVADDSMTTRALEKDILEAAGYQVRVAADGVEAWNVLQETEVNLLVTDGEMPRLDGFDLTARIRADERLKDLPVVLVTSLSSTEDRQRGIVAGADAHIVKGSFEQETLLATIRRLL
jgi:two-component system chemotaxis sensor kinase CheA